MAACFLIIGCTPAGPRALLQGKKLIDEGKHEQAVERLERATVLLPKNANAWNFLGLAYHGNQQFEDAAKAYRTALSLDHKLSAVRYNLGCLYVEQNNLAAAIDELKSFTLLQPIAAEGWVKMGDAQLRARRLDEAERSFRTAIELHPGDPEALNGLGLIQIQRRRWVEAANHFNAAALPEPPYGPALLNSAVVQHQYLNNHSLALQRYRRYLEIQPRRADWESVDATVRQLEQELNPVATTSRSTPPPSRVQSTVRSNVTIPAAFSAQRPVTTQIRTNRASTNVLAKNIPAVPVPKSNTAVTITKTSLESPQHALRPATNKSVEHLAVQRVEVEVSQVAPDFVVKPAQELTSPPSSGPLDREMGGLPGAGTKSGTNHTKRSLFSRLNPFGGKLKTGSVESRPQPPIPADTVAPPHSQARYSYLAPLAPTPGNRLDAEKAFKRGLKSHKDGDRAIAITEYQRAVRSDPAYYDAYYNLGLAAIEKGDSGLALWAYEIALALKPDSADARYNFGLALKAGGYWQDAADQLQRILSGNSSDARAHLSLANLYSQQLQQASLARTHYQQVLDLNPRHPEASKIRYWLAANP